jgi:lambda family phage portal protein
MGFADKLAGWFGYSRNPVRVSGYAAAEIGRLTASLQAETRFINDTLRYQLRVLRARSRQARQNNPFARRFVQMVVDNVCGPTPFRLQAKVKFNSGELDTAANRRIEEGWSSWSRKGVCEISGRWSWNQVQRLLIGILATDGELLVRRYRGEEYGAHGYQLQIIDVDRLDDLMNKSLAGGGAIHMGVEVDDMSKPVAYHILRRKPSQWQAGYTPRESDRVPADEIVHLFVPEFADQVRGVPWMYSALLNLVHIGAFEEAAVIAARVGAAQMGFIQSPDGSPPPGDGSKDVKGNPQINADPGSFPTLPPGYEMAAWNPKYPDAAIGPFLKACLRGVAVGVNVAYHNLSGDMEGVNYSSARIAELDERDSWMSIQSFVAEHLHQDLYDDWLRWQVLLAKLPFDFARLDKYRTVYWQGRRWAWVDPQKEVSAAVEAIHEKLKSRTRVIAEGGDDIEDVFEEIEAEEKLAARKKIKLPDGGEAKPAAPAKPEEEQPKE